MLCETISQELSSLEQHVSVVKILYVISIEDAKYYLEPNTIPQFVVLF